MQLQNFGRYLVRQRIATGGMGEVYVAEQTGVGDFRKPLALKIMLPTLTDDERYIRLFLSEARVAARLTHPNIVQVFDAGLTDGRYFIAMELVEGCTLSELIKAQARGGGAVGVEVICHVARQTLEALKYAHQLADTDGKPLELVHRDISPSNILVSRRGEVKLTDFGIAKIRGAESNTAPGEVRGKLAYIAPEIFRGATASPRSDLFALGVTLYRLAALQSPFGSADDSDPISNLARRELHPLATRRPDLPAALCRAIDQAISNDPVARPPSAAAMLDAFPRGDLEARQEALARLLQTAPPPAAPRTLHTAPFELGTRTVTDGSASAPLPPAGLRRPPLVLLGAVALLLFTTGVLLAVRVFVPPPGPPLPSKIGTGAPEATPLEPPPLAAEVPPLAAEPEPAGLEQAGDVASKDGAAPPDDSPARDEAPVRGGTRPGRAVPARHSQRLSPPALLTVQAQPWANVEINGRPVGQTPLARVPVTSATVVLKLTNPGYQPLERRFKLAAGEELKVSESLIAR